MKKSKLAIGLLCAVLSVIVLTLSACTGQTSDSTTTVTKTVTASATASAPEVFELKMQTNFAPDTNMALMQPYFASELEKRTNGRIKITEYYSEALGKFTDHPQLLLGGVVDIANLHPIQPGFDFFSITNMPFLIDTAGLNLDVCNAVYTQGLFSTLFEDQGFKPLYFQSTPMAMLFMRDKKVTNLDEIAGLKIRGSTPMQLAMIEALGATPVSIPTADVYMALDRGTVDGLITMPDFVYQFKIYEVVKYCIWLPLGINQEAVSMNLDVWNSLPADLQVIIMDLSKEVSYRFLEAVESPDDYRQLLNDYLDIYTLSDADTEEWKTALLSIESNAVAEWEAAGHQAGEALALMKRIIAAYGK